MPVGSNLFGEFFQKALYFFLFLIFEIIEFAGEFESSFWLNVDNASGFGISHNSAFYLAPVHRFYRQNPHIFNDAFPDLIQISVRMISTKSRGKTTIDLSFNRIDASSQILQQGRGLIFYFTKSIYDVIYFVGDKTCKFYFGSSFVKAGIILPEFFKKFDMGIGRIGKVGNLSEARSFQYCFFDLKQAKFPLYTVKTVIGNRRFAGF